MEEEEKKEAEEVEEKKERKAPAYETKTIDIFKLLLGYNYHKYGTKKESL